MPPIDELVINGILHWRYVYINNPWHEYTKEQLTARLVIAEQTIKDLQNAQTE